MKVIILKYYVRMAVFVALFFGAIQPNYAHQKQQFCAADLPNYPNTIATFAQDLEAPNGSALKTFFEENVEGVRAWETLINHPILRTDQSILAKASSVIQKGHISTTDITAILRVNAGLGNRAEAVSKLLDDLDHFALYRDANGFGAIISGLKANWFNGAGADGANWVIAILKKEGTGIFPAPPITNFEVQSAIGSVRRYDAVVSQAGQPKKFFEFKSYSSVPPTDFNTQFINDLNNPEITDLSQLKWIFDAAKNPANFETGMKAAIDGLDLSINKIPISTLQRLGVSNEVG